MRSLEAPGLVVPPMTPFTPDGDLDYRAYDEQIEYIVEECDPSAVALMAVEAQEYRCLNAEQRREAIERGLAAVDGRVPAIVGASAPSVERSVELGAIAQEADVRAVQLLIPRRPQGGDHRIDELVTYFERVGSLLGRPIVAYHNPGPGASLSPEELATLAELEAVIGFKESTRNLRHVLRCIESIDRAELANYYTTMELLLITLLMGGSGGTMPAPAATIAADLVDAVEAGDVDEAIELQRSFATFPGPFLHHGFPTVMKAALEHVGIDAGVPYPPASPIEGEDARAIADRLTEIGL